MQFLYRDFFFSTSTPLNYFPLDDDDGRIWLDLFIF